MGEEEVLSHRVGEHRIIKGFMWFGVKDLELKVEGFAKRLLEP